LTPDGLTFLAENRLRPLGLLADPQRTAGPAPTKADPVLSVRLHTTLIPERRVQMAGRLLAPLFAAPVIVCVLIALTVTDVLLVAQANLSTATQSLIGEPVMLLAVVALTLLSALFHELGHAAGCYRGGGRPGRIGFGLYLIFPAFYTNVNDAYRLSRRARLRTDLGGVYFSGIAALTAGVGYLATQSSILLLVALLNQIGLLQQLLPIVRLDGYYILGDLTGVPDMFGRVKPLLLSLLPGRPTNPDVKNMRPRIRTAVTAWVLLTVPILALGTALLVLQLPTIAATTVTTWQQQWDVAANAWTAGEYVVVALAVITVLLASLPILGMGLLIFVLTGRVAGIVSRHNRKPQPRSRRPTPDAADDENILRTKDRSEQRGHPARDANTDANGTQLTNGN
jgi:putative peptide zinc metalloprotease protein